MSSSVASRAAVDFFYSIGSRYSYLASTQIDALERDTGCTVRWRPLCSADLMALRGHNPFAGAPVSGQYERDYRRRDAERWAAYYGVAYREPLDVRFEPRLLARACVVADRMGAVRPCSHSLFRAVFVDGVPTIDADECARRATSVGLPAAAFAAHLEHPDVDAALAASAAAARVLGAFGVPTFVVGDQLYWGNDRLALLRHALTTARRRA